MTEVTCQVDQPFMWDAGFQIRELQGGTIYSYVRCLFLVVPLTALLYSTYQEENIFFSLTTVSYGN